MRTSILISLLALATTSGCSTGQQRARYELAREFITVEHEKALFGPAAPWISPQDMKLNGLTPGTLRSIQDTYFAVTKDRIDQECTEHFLACKDPLTFEYVVRRVHNSEILASRESKLKSLDSWTRGETSDEDFLKIIGWSAWPTVETTATRSPALAQRP